MNPQHPIVSFILCSLIGAYVMWFSRRMSTKSDWYIANWQSWLPRKPWSQKAVKALAVFCMCGGLLILTQPFIALHHCLLIVARSSRSQWGSSLHLQQQSSFYWSLDRRNAGFLDSSRDTGPGMFFAHQ